MRPIKLLWKDFQILIEFFVYCTKQDIKDTLASIVSAEEYKNKAKSVKSTINNFTKPRALYYYSIALCAIAIAKLNKYWIVLSIILMVYFYFKKLWMTGEQFRYYKERYY